MTKPLHSSQRIVDVDRGIVEIDVIPNKELEALIFSYGKDIEVLAPEAFRGKIQDVIRQTYEKYFGVQADCIHPC